MDVADASADADSSALAYLLLFAAVAVVFWCLSVVCEERFVPALAVVCDVFGIPDDVAGATLMAAGASSPEVFSSPGAGAARRRKWVAAAPTASSENGVDLRRGRGDALASTC